MIGLFRISVCATVNLHDGAQSRLCTKPPAGTNPNNVWSPGSLPLESSLAGGPLEVGTHLRVPLMRNSSRAFKESLGTVKPVAVQTPDVVSLLVWTANEVTRTWSQPSVEKLYDLRSLLLP